ncbi:hypothetical protein QN354_18445 [Cryobacterium sp. 5I3]|nr:hypothetical protein [Cryobacterium sp. 5I3]MEB0203710.1 hypothetical protein [Cryobacterium sp. 5I3]
MSEPAQPATPAPADQSGPPRDVDPSRYRYVAKEDNSPNETKIVIKHP